ncbi:hypothetical protein GRJ2_002529800 [Grus japonensis]|uniref:Uncharacterized protein n=1 Tax=Grus japonensis TaxID=30415 RepID=A0ABC9XSE7_GRUJA
MTEQFAEFCGRSMNVQWPLQINHSALKSFQSVSQILQCKPVTAGGNSVQQNRFPGLGIQLLASSRNP